MTTLDTSDWGLTAADDDLHPRTDDPWWTETVWFAWMVPERNLLGYFYPVLRPNKGVQSGGVLVMDDTGVLPWELPAFDWDWHQPIPEGLDLRDATFAGGMRLQCLEPMRAWQLGYSGRELELDLRVEAAMKPLVTLAVPPFNKGHIDQICRVTGSVVLQGERIEVDCFAMRDRSWGPRQDGRQPTVGYDYGTADADNGFLTVSVRTPERDGITTGFLNRDGVWARIVGGERWTERGEDGRPTTVRIEATDELGRSLRTTCETTARQVFTAYPTMFCWDSLARWSGDLEGWGEDQDCWHPRRWRRFMREEHRPAR
ncbi:MAG: hypothetical protein JWL64_82 [Frankiales bacterium]|nr:hypothetical protein [Frankiales bacterium]